MYGISVLSPSLPPLRYKHDQVAPRAALRPRDVGQKRRCRKPDGKRRHAAPNEIAPASSPSEYLLEPAGPLIPRLNELIIPRPRDQVRKPR